MLIAPAHVGRWHFIYTAIKMRSLLLFAIAVVVLSLPASAAKVDTLDYWHVFYNNRVVGKFNQTSANRQIVIKKIDFKPADLLSVNYGNDAPCKDCLVGLYVKGETSKIKLAGAKGTFAALKVSVKSIISVMKTLDKNTIQVFYYDRYRDIPIFEIKLE